MFLTPWQFGVFAKQRRIKIRRRIAQQKLTPCGKLLETGQNLFLGLSHHNLLTTQGPNPKALSPTRSS
jgi:hypothetical protein